MAEYTVEYDGMYFPYKVLYAGVVLAYFNNIYDANMYMNALLSGKMVNYEVETTRTKSG